MRRRHELSLLSLQASPGRQWFVHCIYSIRSKKTVKNRVEKRSLDLNESSHYTMWSSMSDLLQRPKRFLEDTYDIGEDGRGTNMHSIQMTYGMRLQKTHISLDADNIVDATVPMDNNFTDDSLLYLISIVVGVCGLSLIIVVAVLIILRRRRTPLPSVATSAMTNCTSNNSNIKIKTSGSIITVIDATNGNAKVIASKQYCKQNLEDTEV